MLPSRTVIASAPIRICDNGGWTDTQVAEHGRVFNIAVRPLVKVRIDVFPRGSRQDRVVINADNYATRYAAPAPDHGVWGPYPLIEAALRAVAPPGNADVEVTVGSRAPAGASTGTSAAVAVALVGAFDRLAGRQRPAMEIANEAHAIETQWLGRHSGVQDQLCSAFGGVNFIEITNYPHASVTPLHIDHRMHGELNARLVLIYLGRPHSSSTVHEQVIKTLERLGPDCAQLNALRSAAERARDAFVAGDLEALGLAMRQNTDAQAALHGALVHPDAWRVIDIAAAHGALGWKVNGAGGDGGSITLLGDGRRNARRAMIRAITQENAAFVPVPQVISRRGLNVYSDNFS